MIFEQDEELLKYITDIRHLSEETSDNYTLEFYFADNPIIENSVLTKQYIMGNDDEVKTAKGTEIKWKGTNLTQKVKKTKKKGKNKKAGIKVEEIPSFFSFFKDVNEDDEDEPDSEDEEAGLGGLLEDDFEVACEFRDEVIPNAIYYYLNVRDEDGENSEEGNPKNKQVDGSGTEKAECKPQ